MSRRLGWRVALPLAALALQPAAWGVLEALYLAAYGPAAAEPQARHVVAGQAWLAVYGFSSVSLGLASIYTHLRWSHLGVAVPLVVLMLPGLGLGTFALYFWLACQGLV